MHTKFCAPGNCCGRWVAGNQPNLVNARAAQSAYCPVQYSAIENEELTLLHAFQTVYYELAHSFRHARVQDYCSHLLGPPNEKLHDERQGRIKDANEI